MRLFEITLISMLVRNLRVIILSKSFGCKNPSLDCKNIRMCTYDNLRFWSSPCKTVWSCNQSSVVRSSWKTNLDSGTIHQYSSLTKFVPFSWKRTKLWHRIANFKGASSLVGSLINQKHVCHFIWKSCFIELVSMHFLHKENNKPNYLSMINRIILTYISK